jgi:hypothetical protein
MSTAQRSFFERPSLPLCADQTDVLTNDRPLCLVLKETAWKPIQDYPTANSLPEQQ